jgi:hypothetical protein
VDLLEELSDELGDRGVAVRVAEATGPVRDTLRTAGAAERVGANYPRTAVQAVVDGWKADQSAEGKSPSNATPSTDAAGLNGGSDG